MADKIFIRDTETGQTSLMSRGMLNHPHWKHRFEEVRTDKPVNAALHKPRGAQRLTEPASTYYDQFTIAELTDQIDERNANRSDSDLITPQGNKKADLIASLDADDVATAEKGN